MLGTGAATAGRADDSVLVQEAVALELPRLAPALATLHGPEPTLATAAQALKSDAGDAVDADRAKATEALPPSPPEALGAPGGERTPGRGGPGAAARPRSRLIKSFIVALIGSKAAVKRAQLNQIGLLR